MSFEWPLDKLGCINSALSQTGDNQISAADDGSVEWNTASPAYERALAYMMEQHGWSSSTQVKTLNRSPTAPTDDQYDSAYPIPNDLVHLIWVRVGDHARNYDLLNGQLVLNGNGAASGVVTIKGVFSTNSDPAMQTPSFVLALITFVMSGIYRGLHNDTGEADKMWMGARSIMQEAKTRHDQQKPKRAIFRSRLVVSRRVRRPWPLLPPGNDDLG